MAESIEIKHLDKPNKKIGWSSKRYFFDSYIFFVCMRGDERKFAWNEKQMA